MLLGNAAIALGTPSPSLAFFSSNRGLKRFDILSNSRCCTGPRSYDRGYNSLLFLSRRKIRHELEILLGLQLGAYLLCAFVRQSDIFAWTTVLDHHLDVHPNGQRASFVAEDGQRVFFERKGKRFADGDEVGYLLGQVAKLKEMNGRVASPLMT